MSNKASTPKSILWGILLGLVVIAGLLFYPDIAEYFKSKTPQIVQKAKEVAHEKEVAKKILSAAEKLKQSAIETFTKKDEKKPAPSPPKEIEGDKGTYASLKETTAKPVAPTVTREGKKKTVPYYSEEESLWRELLKKPMNSEYVNDYPYAECFKASAEENKLPVALVLGLARHLSNFEPESEMDHKVGIMRLDPSRSSRAKKDELINDPCQSIKMACGFLSALLSQSGGDLVPALVAYRDQMGAVHPENIKNKDLFFSSRLKKHVEDVLSGPFEKRVMYTFWKFDDRITAEGFMASLENKTGVELWLGQKGFNYVVYIPASNEEEKRGKVALIKEKAGVEEK